MHKIEEDNVPEEDDEATVDTVNNKEEDEARADKEQQPEEVVPPAPIPQPRVVQELNCNLDKKHWGDGIVRSVIHECVIGPVIQDYGNLEATLSTSSYEFQKGMKEFKELGYEARAKELDKNLIGRDVIDCCRESQSLMT